ncbi:MAG: CDP-glucose 4,6-dehydratase [Zetaproteobacteria bacterium]|nr:CDP-glucose 4,6-dehydratase [Zetaproteobacteria bacterium]
MWKNRSVLVTGHTGFKGSWLALMLRQLGARVSGYALAPEPDSLFQALQPSLGLAESFYADIRNPEDIQESLRKCQPEVVFHLAAQPLVRRSLEEPLVTYATNVMGTANLLDACRSIESLKAVVVVTTDKVYAPAPKLTPFKESDTLGGKDPYSSSKSACELLTQSFRESYFAKAKPPLVASARAGNVIGPGDMSEKRIVPDIVRAYLYDQSLALRFPDAVRPWQHVADPLLGYLYLAENLLCGDASAAEAWNFGSHASLEMRVDELVQLFYMKLGGRLQYSVIPDAGVETRYLALDSQKARDKLGWAPQVSVTDTVDQIIRWMKKYEISAQQAAAEVVKYSEEYLSTNYQEVSIHHGTIHRSCHPVAESI